MIVFPDIEPYEHGMLGVGDGQDLYWEVCGNPEGLPALVLHGGPGSGCQPMFRRYFDPSRYRVVLMDQRGCGRSTPRVGADTDLTCNTTWHLVADLERLREHLGIDRWLVWGVSWGVTLALVYAETHPERIRALVLASVTLTRPSDIRWLYHDAGRFFPEEWERFRSHVPAELRDRDLVAAYHHLLNVQPDHDRRAEAARHWCEWEDTLLSLEPGWTPNPRYSDEGFRMTFARVVSHYFHHRAWLEDDHIVRHADRLAGLPGALVHGRFDLSGPAEVAWTLSRAWPDAHLTVVDGGHGATEETLKRIVGATNRYAERQPRP